MNRRTFFSAVIAPILAVAVWPFKEAKKYFTLATFPLDWHGPEMRKVVPKENIRLVTSIVSKDPGYFGGLKVDETWERDGKTFNTQRAIVDDEQREEFYRAFAFAETHRRTGDAIEVRKPFRYPGPPVQEKFLAIVEPEGLRLL